MATIAQMLQGNVHDCGVYLNHRRT